VSVEMITSETMVAPCGGRRGVACNARVMIGALHMAGAASDTPTFGKTD